MGAIGNACPSPHSADLNMILSHARRMHYNYILQPLQREQNYWVTSLSKCRPRWQSMVPDSFRARHGNCSLPPIECFLSSKVFSAGFLSVIAGLSWAWSLHLDAWNQSRMGGDDSHRVRCFHSLLWASQKIIIFKSTASCRHRMKQQVCLCILLAVFFWSMNSLVSTRKYLKTQY